MIFFKEIFLKIKDPNLALRGIRIMGHNSTSNKRFGSSIQLQTRPRHYILQIHSLCLKRYQNVTPVHKRLNKWSNTKTNETN